MKKIITIAIILSMYWFTYSDYIVYPKYWIVAPVLTPNKKDSKLIDSWLPFNHIPYLQKGVLHYFWYSPSISPSNMVIAWHTDWYMTWQYSNVFSKLPLATSWDTVVYYEKVGKTYKKYTYVVVSSYETNKYDTSILKYENNWEYYLTVYTCYPKGWKDGRRVNKAVLQ